MTARRAGDLVFVAGQPDGRGDVATQSRRAFDRLERALEEHGAGLDDVVDLISFHRDIRDVDALLDAGRERLGADPPAWTPVGMSGATDPDALVVLRAIAHVGGGPKRSLTPDGVAWMRGYPMAGACRRGDLVFVSGQSALDAAGEVVAPGDHVQGSRVAYERVKECLAAADASLDDVIDICSFHLDPRGMVPSEAINPDIWTGVRPDNAPSWTAIGVPALFVPGALSQYRMIADTSEGPRVGRVSASIHWKDTPNAGASRKAGGTLIGIAGEVASDGDGNVTTPGDTVAQAHYAFRRIREVVELHGSSMDRVVEVTTFHKDPRAWELVMEAGRDYFEPGAGPAWTAVTITGLWNAGYLHEIYALAVL